MEKQKDKIIQKVSCNQCSGYLSVAMVAALMLFAIAGCTVTPQPFSTEEFSERARNEMGKLYENQEPLGDRLSLYDAMARAVKYNLDHQVKQMEEALARGHLVQAHNDLLPQLVASAGYSKRSNDSGSSSRSLLTGIESLEVSTSQERSQYSADIIQVWNVLDFGVGYARAQQMADEVLISEEWRRKTVQNIVQDVRLAYWRAAVAELLLPKMDAQLKEVRSALGRSREMEKMRLQAPVKTLAYQQELLETVKQLWRMRKELTMAKTELASLINLKPGSTLHIGLDTLPPPVVAGGEVNLANLEELALINRPELRVEAYQDRIGALEVRKALLSMLPGLEVNLSANYDDNSFLYNNNWMQLGGRLSWNIFSLFSGPNAVKSANLQQELAQKRYMALAMMTLTQVHLANQRYGIALREYRIANALADVHQRKLKHAAAARKANVSNELEEIRNQAGNLSALMYSGLAYAELQSALGRVFHSSGIDPLPPVVEDTDLVSLSKVMQKHEQTLVSEWASGVGINASTVAPAVAKAPETPAVVATNAPLVKETTEFPKPVEKKDPVPSVKIKPFAVVPPNVQKDAVDQVVVDDLPFKDDAPEESVATAQTVMPVYRVDNRRNISPAPQDSRAVNVGLTSVGLPPAPPPVEPEKPRYRSGSGLLYR